MSTTCITQISVEKIETTLCVSSGKGLNPGNSVLVEAFGVSGGVETGGLPWTTDSKSLQGDQEAIAAAIRTTVSRPSELVTRCWNTAPTSLKLFPITWQQEQGLHLTSTYQSSTTISRASYWPSWLMTSALILTVFKKGNF